MSRLVKRNSPVAIAANDEDTPLYRRVVDVIRGEIASGHFKVGARLPTEDGLCQRFGVSRHTVREALRALRAEGLVESRQGAGTTVLRRDAASLYTYSVASIEELLQYATRVRYQVSRSGIVIADDRMAERLGCQKGDRWLRVEGFRYADGERLPVCWTEVFIRAEYAGIGMMIGRRTGTIYSWIEEMYGVRVETVEQQIRCEPMPAVAARGLKAKPGSTAVGMHRYYRLGDGTLIEVATNIHAADRFNYTVKLDRR
ncbi:MAG: GntR family transcriptional regulator [Hyphomicrobiales bacterium]|nr:MAG: GntR family transcriptional regulator [Hyphomicrobiales bacterium]